MDVSDKQIVSLELTTQQVKQLTRLLGMAKMVDGRDFMTEQRPDKMDIIAYRAFLQELLNLLNDSIKRE